MHGGLPGTPHPRGQTKGTLTFIVFSPTFIVPLFLPTYDVVCAQECLFTSVHYPTVFSLPFFILLD